MVPPPTDAPDMLVLWLNHKLPVKFGHRHRFLGHRMHIQVEQADLLNRPRGLTVCQAANGLTTAPSWTGKGRETLAIGCDGRLIYLKHHHLSLAAQLIGLSFIEKVATVLYQRILSSQPSNPIAGNVQTYSSLIRFVGVPRFCTPAKVTNNTR